MNKIHARSVMLITGGVDATVVNPRFALMFPELESSKYSVEQEVVCLPSFGTRLFWIGFRPFLFSRTGGRGVSRHNGLTSNMVNDQGDLKNALTLTTIGWDLVPLHKFTALCRKFKRKSLNGTTTVYFASGQGGMDGEKRWQSVSKAARKLDTIDMDEDIKLDIIQDAEHYYSEQSRQFFADCGIPYRRGYLFHGPPVTGKSSLSLALAGHLRCYIYYINLASGHLNDGALHSLFLALPRKCMVVLEDIDSAGVGREHGPLAQKQTTAPSVPSKLAGLMDGASPSIDLFAGGFGAPAAESRARHNRSLITLSGLLNAVDGNASQEDRPGRVDKRVYFGNVNKSAGRSIFMRLIGRSALAHDAMFTAAEIEEYADEFAEKLPANTFTPAEVQNFLQGCHGEPAQALVEIDAWVVENRDKPNASSTLRNSAFPGPQSDVLNEMRDMGDSDNDSL